MNALANIILDMQRPAHTVVYAVQNDRLTRKITAQLVNAGIPWTVPTGALMMIRYSKPDGTTGFYDTDEAGATAYTISGSTVTFTMVQQALAVAGNVAVQLSFYTAGGDQLSTFAFVITVQPSVYNDAEIISSDYFNVLAGTIGEIAAEIQQFETALAAGYGAPLVASTVAGMTDHAKIYVYTGSESGYVSGNWYYWNGTAWTSGGVYNAVAVDLDATLTSATKPAQAKAVGDAVSELKSDIDAIGVAAITFEQEAYTVHASVTDQVHIFAKSGERINITVTSDTENSFDLTKYLQYYAYYTDGTNNRIGMTQNHSPNFTLEKDLQSIGLYLNGTTVLLNCNITITVKVLSDRTFYGDYNQFKNSQTENAENLIVDMQRIRDYYLPFGDIINNSYVDKTDGSIVSYNNWSRTDYVNVSELKELYPVSSVSSTYNCFYDSEKVFISAFTVSTTQTRVKVPDNAFYAIFSNTTEGMGNMKISYVKKFENQTDIIDNAFTGVYCENDITSKLLEYGEILSTSGVADSYLFFTDPHLFYNYTAGASGWLIHIFDKMPIVQKTYNSVGVSFCLCGGDWLSNNDTPAEAATKLGYVTGMMKNLFDKYYMIIGNHDTNYQGTQQLSDDSLVNLMFGNIGKMYYTFKNPYSRFYIFDTGKDWEHAMNSYRWEQIAWFAAQLLENDDDHSVLGLHIVTNQYKADFEESPSYENFANNITLLAEAYNSKTSITLNSITYDFSNTTGVIEYAIAGHSHFDAITTLNNIPIMITDWLRDGSTATFDLVLSDYTNHVVKTVRIGSGSNRTMNMSSYVE